MSKLFKDKKEYYSLRKFKGVGLASALVGLAFLSPSVMAEEVATSNTPTGDVSVVSSSSETAPVTSENTIVGTTNTTSEVVKEGSLATENVVENSATTVVVDKPTKVSTPVVAEPPKVESPKLEEAPIEKPSNESSFTDRSNESAVTESNQPTRLRRSKRDVSGSSTPMRTYYSTTEYVTTDSSNVQEVDKIDYTTSKNPSPAEVGRGIYNNQIESIEQLPTNTPDAYRFRVKLKDDESIPDGGKLLLSSLGLKGPVSADLFIGTDKIGAIKTYSAYYNPESITNRLNKIKDVDSYIALFESMKPTDQPLTSLVLEFNKNFSTYNKNRVVEFELNWSKYNVVNHLINSNESSKRVLIGTNGVEHTPEKSLKGYLLNPYDTKAITAGTIVNMVQIANPPYTFSYLNNLRVDTGWVGVTKPYYFDDFFISAPKKFEVLNRDLSSSSIVGHANDTFKFEVPENSLFATTGYNVGDIVELDGRDFTTPKEEVTPDRFTNSNKFATTKTGESKTRKIKVRFQLVEKTDRSYTWKLVNDLVLENVQLDMDVKKLFPFQPRRDWVSRFGENKLKEFLSGTSHNGSPYLTNNQLQSTLTTNIGGVVKSSTGTGEIHKNVNILFGEATTGSVKVVHKTDAGVTLKEEVVATNKPWYTSINLDPATFEGYQFVSSSETLSTLVGQGDRTIELVYAKPSETVDRDYLPTKYIVDNTKDGTYRNIVEGSPTVTTVRKEYIYSPTTRTSTPKYTTTKVDGRPMVVTIGSKPTTEVTYQDFSTTYVADPTRTAGEKFTETAGVRGTTTVETTYSVNKETGVVTPTKGQPVVVAPRNAVVKVGTKPTVTETTIPVTTKYKADTSIDFGKEEVESQGQVGTRTTTVPKVLNTQDGAVSDGQPTTQETPMTPKVVKKGTKPTVTEKSINFTTVYEADETKGKGVRTDKVAGAQGKVITTTTYTLNESTGNVTANSPTERREEPKNKVVTVGTAPTVTTKRIAYGVEYQRDDTVSATSPSTRVQDGVDGEKRTTVTYSVNPTSGVVTDNAPVETTVAPKPQIEKLGTKPEDIITTQDFKRTFVADENKDLGYRQVETQGIAGKTVVHRTYTLPDNVPPREETSGIGINYEFAVAIPHDSEPEVTTPVNEVTRVGVKPKVETQTIAVTTEYIADESLEFGKVVETEKGSEGRVVTTTTYTMNPADGTTTANKPTVETTPMVQRVVKVGVKKEVVETPIEFTTSYERDETAEAGKKTPSVSGVAGKTITTTTYTMNPTTGVVTENPSTTVREEPTTAVIKVGAKSKVVVTPIPVEVEEVADPELFEGDEKVTSNGKAGSTTTTTEYVVNPKTGEITEKDPVISTVPMEKKVVHKGTKKRKASVTISYVLKETGAALGSATVLENQQVGSPYNTSVKVFEPKVEVSELPDRTITKTTTYVLEKEPENKSGIVTEKGVSVVYTYRAMVREEVVMKESKLTVNFVLEGSGEKLHESLVKEGVRVGDPYVTEPLALKDKVEKRVERNKEVITTTRYELVETPSNAKGAISVGGTAVDYFYRAVVKVDEYPTIPNDAPKTDLPEYTNPIGTPGIPEVHDKPTYLGHVGTPGDSEVHELPEFNGGVVPNDAPKVEIPAYDNGVVPNYAPIHEVPEYTEPLGFVPSDAPQFELPEFKGGVVPNDAPILEKPEYKIPTVSEEPKQPAVPVVEIPQSQPQPQAPQQQFVAKELPNTGTSDSDKLVALSGVGLLGLLGFSFKKRKED